MNTFKMVKGRRDFLKTGIAGLAGMALLPSAVKYPSAEQESKEKTSLKIITRPLGKTGLTLPIISMGVMNADNPHLVKAALDAGIVHLDTAHVYQNGRNEEMIGEVIKDRKRDAIIITTKVVADYEDRKSGLFTERTKPEPFIEKFETSLKRLQTDYVDIFLLHSVVRREAVFFEPLLTAMQKIKQQGKARFIGVSTHRNEPEVLRAVADCKVHDVVLTAYNFRQPHIDDMHSAIEYAVKAGVGIIAMKTQAGVYWDQERKHSINMKAALKWALQNEHVCTAIPGFTTFDQMQLDLSVINDITLTPEEKNDLQLGQKFGLNGL